MGAYDLLPALVARPLFHDHDVVESSSSLLTINNKEWTQIDFED